MKIDTHLHSNFSDGKNTPEEMITAAIRKGLNVVAITDHVRKGTDWLDDYSHEIKRLKERYKKEIKIMCGIEAKVIDLKGNIDARDDFFDKLDIVLGAFHSIPSEKGFITEGDIQKQKVKALANWYKAMLAVLQHPRVNVIAHPTKILHEYGITLPRIMKVKIAKRAKDYGKVFEINIKHNVPDEEFLRILRENKVRMTIGSDSHSVVELEGIKYESFNNRSTCR